jgi:hypothetical protein
MIGLNAFVPVVRKFINVGCFGVEEVYRIFIAQHASTVWTSAIVMLNH